MNVFAAIVCAALIFMLGYYAGKKYRKIDIDKTNYNAAVFYRNLTKKQAAQIEKIQDRLVYLSIGELETFLDFMTDDSDEGFGADENYPILAIVNPLKEEADFNLEDK